MSGHTSPLGGRLPTGAGGGGGAASNEIQAGAQVVAGPDGAPPTGMKAFRVVDDDPTAAPAVSSPAGQMITKRDGSDAWLGLGGTEYISRTQLGRARELANNSSPLLDLALNVAVLHRYIDNTDAYEVIRNFFGSTAQSNAGSLFPPKAAYVAGDWFRLCDGVSNTTFVDYQFQLDATPVEAGRVAIDISSPAVVSGADVWAVVRAAIEAAAPNVVFGNGGNAGLPGPTTAWYQAFSLSPLTCLGSASNSDVNEQHVASPDFHLGQFAGGREAFDILANIATTKAVQDILALPQIRTLHNAEFNFSGAGPTWDIEVTGLDSTRDYELLLTVGSGEIFCHATLFLDGNGTYGSSVTEFVTTPALSQGSSDVRAYRNVGSAYIVAATFGGSGGETMSRAVLRGGGAGLAKQYEAAVAYRDLPGPTGDDITWPVRVTGTHRKDFTSLLVQFDNPCHGRLVVREIRR